MGRSSTGHAPRPIGRAFAVITICALASTIRLGWAAEQEPATVAVLCGSHKSYREAVSEIEATLRGQSHHCVLVGLPKPSKGLAKKPPTGKRADATPGRPGSDPATTRPVEKGREAPQIEQALGKVGTAKPAVIVTVGASATSLAIERFPNTPVIFCMVPNVLDMPFMANGDAKPPQVIGVTTDVSPAAQIAWITKLCPRTGNIGVLYSSRSARTAEAVQAAAKARGITVSAIETRKDEFPKAIDSLTRRGCDAALMLPDARVYNVANVQRLLLWGIRRKKPVWTFSANIVKAGALAGQYSDGRAVGRQTAELVRRVLAGDDVSSIGLQYPAPVHAAVNERTAELIGVRLGRETTKHVTVRYGKKR